MSSTTLTDVWRAIQGLAPADRRQLREWLDGAVSETPPAAEPGAAERKVQQILLAQGRITVPEHPMDVEEFRSWKAVDVQGRPASEILIEERR